MNYILKSREKHPPLNIFYTLTILSSASAQIPIVHLSLRRSFASVVFVFVFCQVSFNVVKSCKNKCRELLFLTSLQLYFEAVSH